MKKKIGAALLSLSLPICIAGTPASTADVNAAAAILQAQINALNTEIDTTIANLNALPAVAHPIGSCYGGGVVFYVNSDPNAPAGQQGLIAKLENSTSGCTGGSGTCEWANPTIGLNLGTSPGLFTGQNNTNIVKTHTGAEAANAAYDTTPAADCPTCTNWYLPAQYELYTLYAQSSLSGSSLWTGCGGTPPATSSEYWASTQGVILVTAILVNFDSGVASFGITSTPHLVRAIRAF